MISTVASPPSRQDDILVRWAASAQVEISDQTSAIGISIRKATPAAVPTSSVQPTSVRRHGMVFCLKSASAQSVTADIWRPTSPIGSSLGVRVCRRIPRYRNFAGGSPKRPFYHDCVRELGDFHRQFHLSSNNFPSMNPSRSGLVILSNCLVEKCTAQSCAPPITSDHLRRHPRHI